ncbi:hypothetical protein [Archangium violaceum]|uniref:hypothetical protein n=1 Tax=Archangium violaceum TaxID=83451 RepID=UPI001EF61BA3|nr:hypothetical protein [Archangium violaceum]
MTIETVSSMEVYRNRWMTVREDAIRRQDGSSGIYGVVHKPDFSPAPLATPRGAAFEEAELSRRCRP